MIHKPSVLIVLDGWGIAPPSRANAITTAKTPFFDSLVARYPTAVLQASGEAAGLPWSEVGNSEVGHMSIGAGRIVFQDLSRITNAIVSREFFTNPSFKKAIEHVTAHNSALHIIGMASTSGVHSHIDHLFALCEIAASSRIPCVYLHLILDGRDAPYASGLGFVRSVLERTTNTPIRIASISGRMYAMDRDNHWERTEKVYRAIMEGTGERTSDEPLESIKQSYDIGVYDEEFTPTVITENGTPVAQVRDNDSLIMFNIRADRARQLAHAFAKPDFARFPISRPTNLFVVTMTQYDEQLSVEVAFPPQIVSRSLAECVSESNMRQIHIAETEKYAHITYFLNDGREEPFRNEDRKMIPSPRVESYASKPEMGAQEITDSIIAALQARTHDFIAVNFANADMVGHTGDIKATIAAIEFLDKCLARITDACLAHGGALIITADHGNAEGLLDLHTGQIDKEHSNNPVPCIIVASDIEGRTLSSHDVGSRELHTIEPHGMLSDVAPTVLSLLGIQQPSEMTGKNLLSLWLC